MATKLSESVAKAKISSKKNEGMPNELLEKYDMGRKLGRGTFAVVREATDKITKEKFAVKIIDISHQSPWQLNRLTTEVAILKSLRHKHIVELFEVYRGNGSVALVMELVTGGELFDQIVERGHYSEKDAQEVAKCILSSLAYLHAHGVVHRDLKPENLLCTSDGARVKISDFGLSKIMEGNAMLSTPCGTPEYVAPEILMKKQYGANVDMWSFGVILYILLSGCQPFWRESCDDNWNELFRQIKTASYHFDGPSWKDVSKSAIDLVRRCLTVDPTERITAKQALIHPFIQDKDRSLSVENLLATLEAMKGLNEQRKFKTKVLGIIATRRFSMGSESAMAELARKATKEAEEPRELTDEDIASEEMGESSKGKGAVNKALQQAADLGARDRRRGSAPPPPRPMEIAGSAGRKEANAPPRRRPEIKSVLPKYHSPLSSGSKKK